MAIIKLQPGDKIHFTVSNVETVEGNYGPQYKFTGSTPDDQSATLFLNIDPANRQMERISLNAQSIVGQTVEVEKVDKGGQKFTNLNRVNVGQATVSPRPANPLAKQALTSGPRIDAIDGPRPIATPEYGSPAMTAAAEKVMAAHTPTGKLDGVLNLHDVCVDHSLAVTVKKLTTAGIPVTAADVLSAAATMMIGAQKVGAAA